MTSIMKDLSCKSLVPKLNGLSKIKLGNDGNLNGSIGYKNDTFTIMTSKGIMFINPAVYVEKLDLSTPLTRGFSQGDGKYNRQFINGKTLIEEPVRHVNGLVGNGAGDRLSSPISQSSSSSPSEILSDEAQNNDVVVADNLPVKESDTSFESFRSNSAEDLRNPMMHVKKLFNRSYSDLDNGSVASTSMSNVIPNDPFSDVSAPRRYSTRLSASNFRSTFPEENIHKQILSALSENGNNHHIPMKHKGTLPENWENLIPYEDLAWFRWYLSKLELEKQRKESKKSLDTVKRDEEECQRERRQYKQKLDKENKERKCLETTKKKEATRRFELETEAMRREEEEEHERALLLHKQKLSEEWRKRKCKEEAEKKREAARKLELEKKAKELEQVRMEKARKAWTKKKDMEKKEQKLKEEKVKQKQEEEKRLRAQKNHEAFETWLEKSKNRPKPMSVAIKDHKGRSDPTHAHLNWNPIPWNGIVDESKADISKVPEKKKWTKPCRTQSECSPPLGPLLYYGARRRMEATPVPLRYVKSQF
ncbi:hypothetical protein C0J52_12075 [Blattella germanica]|nr:hypothetical protein C0J52_12075 [Blattella germanica]